MEKFYDFNKINKKYEDVFIKTGHLKELEVSFNFYTISDKYNLYYDCDGKLLFRYCKNDNTFYIDLYHVWEHLESINRENYDYIVDIMKPIVKKYFDVKDNIIISWF
ncbi:hypothetical protein M0Q50_10065 [bacterium]|jgi:hypothetical protein|nr:hypothetical protein [bacterium]